jgi:hypothetical protein
MGDITRDGELVKWVIRRGEDWTRTLEFYTDETEATRRPLTGATAKAEIRATEEATAVLLSLDTTVNAALGEVVLNADHDDTDITTWSDGVMDVQLTIGGDVEYIPVIPISIAPTVTRTATP